MKNVIRVSFLSFLLLGSAACFTGCVAIVAGGAAAGGTAYALGDLSVPVEATPAQLERAIKQGGRDLGLQFISGSGDSTAGSYLFRNAEDKKITVKYSTKSAVYYDMSIRVGNLGDEAISIQLQNAILKHL